MLEPTLNGLWAQRSCKVFWYGPGLRQARCWDLAGHHLEEHRGGASQPYTDPTLPHAFRAAPMCYSNKPKEWEKRSNLGVCVKRLRR